MKGLSDEKKKKIAELIQINALDAQDIFDMLPGEIRDNERIGPQLKRQILDTVFKIRVKEILK